MKTYVENPAIIVLSHRYDEMDCIETLDVVLQEQVYQVHSVVRVFDQQTSCLVELNEDGELLHYECQCQWCTEENPCAHIGATLLRLKRCDMSSWPFHFENEKYILLKQKKEKREKEFRLKNTLELTRNSHLFLEQQKHRYQIQIASLLQDRHCHVKPYVFINSKGIPMLEYRIGYDTQYVIRDIDEFLERIKKRELFVYGKMLSLVHEIQAFDLFSQEQIVFLQKISHFYKESMEGALIGRSIVLKGVVLDWFYDLYCQRKYDSFKMIESQEKPVFHTEKNANIVTLAFMNSQDFVYGKNHLYDIYAKEECCYIERWKGDEQGVLISLIQSMSLRTLSIFDEEMPEFSKYIFSIIQDYIEMDCPCEWISHDRIYMYGDIEREQIISFQWKYVNKMNEETTCHCVGYKQDVIENYIKKYPCHIDENQHIAYFEKESQNTQLFLHEGLLFLNDYCHIELSCALKNIRDGVMSNGKDCLSDL